MKKMKLNIQMFASSGTVGSLSGQWKTTYTVTWSLLSQSVENNTSTIRLTSTLYTGNSTTISSSYSNFVTDGTTMYSGSYSKSGAGNVFVGTKDITVTHNSDGTFPGRNVSFSTNDYIMGSQSGSGTITGIATIPRASTVSCSSPYIGDNAIITIDRKSSSFTSTVWILFGNINQTIATKTSLTTLAFNTNDIKSQLYAQIPTSKSGWGIIYCDTYNGNTKIGSTQSSTFYLYAKEEDCKPAVTGTVIDTNSDTISLTGDSSIIVKNASKPRVSVSATPKYSSTITSYSINLNDGQTSNQQQYTFDTINSNSITVSATDSRGYTTSFPIDLTDRVIDYVKLAFNSVNLQRTESTSNEIVLNANGSFYNGNFGDNSIVNGLRHIRVGDDLSGKTVYFQFPDSSEHPISQTNDVIVVNTNNKFIEDTYFELGYGNGGQEATVSTLSLYYDGAEDTTVYKKISDGMVDGEIYSYTALDNLTLPNDFGTVTQINTSSAMYQYIYIQDQSSTNNTLSINYQYKRSGDENWTDGTVAITPTIDNNTFSITNLSLGNIYSYNEEWQFKIIATDLLMTVGSEEKDIHTVTKGIPVVEIGDELVNVNGVFTINDLPVTPDDFPKTKTIGDGTGSTLIATFTSTRAYERNSIIIATAEAGNTDNTDSGMAIIGFGTGGSTSELFSSVLNLGNIHISIQQVDNTLQVWIQKTVHYRHLDVYILGIRFTNSITLNL